MYYTMNVTKEITLRNWMQGMFQSDFSRLYPEN